MGSLKSVPFYLADTVCSKYVDQGENVKDCSSRSFGHVLVCNISVNPNIDNIDI